MTKRYPDSDSALAPVRNAEEVTFDNSPPEDHVFAEPTRGVMVTVAGNLNVVFVDQTAAVVVPVLAKTYYPFAVKEIKVSSTTATGIIGFF